MAWARCPTHGPIQDASEVWRGDTLADLVCSCGLSCSEYEPSGFVEHEELVELQKTKTQPKDDDKDDALDAPKKGAKDSKE